MENKESQDNKGFIILDTNILQYTNNDYFGDKIIQILKEAADVGFRLAISGITIYEALDNLSVEKTKDALELLNSFYIINVTDRILYGATQLTNIYKNMEIGQNGISKEDKIIGASAIISDSYILTANISDFPSPIFKSQLEEKIEYKNKKDISCLLVLQMLKADGDIIDKKIEELQYNI